MSCQLAAIAGLSGLVLGVFAVVYALITRGRT